MQKNIQLNVLPSGMFCCHIADGATATESTTGRICVHPAPGLWIFLQNTLWQTNSLLWKITVCNR